MSSVVTQLLKHSQIWQASRKESRIRPALTTGYAALDCQLHYAGWPQGAVSELLLSHNGIGEIRLLTPLLARLSKQAGYITWINPPFRPYGPALVKQQVQLDKMVVVRAGTVQESVWAARQALVSKACSAVLLWLPAKSLNKEIRQLSLAAKSGNCWGIIFRPQQFQQQPSAATLRIVMQLKQRQQALSIIKQPGGWSGQQVHLNLFPERAHWNALAVDHWPVFSPLKSSLENNQAVRRLTHQDNASQATGALQTTQTSFH
jgi:cell division inhibitor SulA